MEARDGAKVSWDFLSFCRAAAVGRSAGVLRSCRDRLKFCLALAALLCAFPVLAPAGPVFELPATESLQYALHGSSNGASAGLGSVTSSLLFNDTLASGSERPLYGTCLLQIGQTAGSAASVCTPECAFGGCCGHFTWQMGGGHTNSTRLQDDPRGEGMPLSGVPAPGTVVLGSVGVCIVGWIRRFSLV